MRPTHAATGTLVGAATARYLPPDPVTRLAWVAVCGGCALLPDLDHLQASITRMWGPFSHLLARVVHRVSGGHRWGTHDPVLGPLAFTLAAWAAWFTHWGRVSLTAVTIGLVMAAFPELHPGKQGRRRRRGHRVIRVSGWVTNLAISWGLAWVAADRLPWWVIVAVPVGVLSHLAGDVVTEQGLPVPIVWIRDRDRRWRLGSFDTGRWPERWLICPLLTAATLWVMATEMGA